MKTNTHTISTNIKFPHLAPAAFAAAALLIGGAANAAGSEPWDAAQPTPGVATPAPTTASEVQTPKTSPVPPGNSPSYTIENPKFFHFGAGVYHASFSGGDALKVSMNKLTLGGISFGGGSRFSKSDLGSVLLYGELGVYAGQHDCYYNSKYRGLDLVVVPVSFVGAYEFKVTETISLRAGAHVGPTLFNGKFSPWSAYEGKNKFRQIVFSGGAIAGASLKLDQNWNFDLSYKYSSNTGLSIFKDSQSSYSNAHQLTVGLGYRF
jgi:opacity protein-like surface antigen